MKTLKPLVLSVALFCLAGIASASAQVSLRGIYTSNVSSTLSVLFGVRDNNDVDVFVFDYSQHNIGKASTTIDSSGSFTFPASVIGYGISGTLSATGSSAQIAATLTYSGWSQPQQITVPRSVWFGANDSNGISIINGRFTGMAVDQTSPGKGNVTFIVDSNNDLYLVHETAAGVFYGGVGTVTPNSGDTGGTFSVNGVHGAIISGSFTTNAFVMNGTFTNAENSQTYDFNAFRDAAAHRLGNVSTRGFVGTGQNVLIGGFVIGGGPKLVLIRVLGPSLAQFGITSPLEAPTLTLSKGGTQLATNTGWQNQSSQTIVQQIEATQLAPYSTGDDAILIELEEGAYTAEVSGVGGTTGTALVEVYEVLLD
jgi:hypothetical protein